MTDEIKPLSIRLPNDAHTALAAYATAEGVTVSEAVIEAIYAFLAEQRTTSVAAAKRMAAETELSKLVLERAKVVRNQDYDFDVTKQMFDWIQNDHLATYGSAVGPNAEHAYRINPQLAKRFAYAIGADYERDEQGKPKKSYLPRNANKLIQSFTNLRKP